jgi:predicted nucleotidyltransferase
MKQAIREQITAITQAIVETIPVERIYLFGSYAYGTPHEDSDLDIYVVMKDDAPYRETEATQKIWTAIRGKKSLPADILVLKNNRFQYRLSAPTLEHEVAEKGVILYG